MVLRSIIKPFMAKQIYKFKELLSVCLEPKRE